MRETYYTVEENGARGARQKAELLLHQNGYLITSIRHTMILKSGALSYAPDDPRYGAREMGYAIEVETKPSREELLSAIIPPVIEG